MSRSIQFALFTLLLSFFGAHGRLLSASPSNSDSELRGFDSIFQFGDSLSDTGNLMREKPGFFCANKPYGETLGKEPTGRCSNGLLMIDYIANEFNVPLLNPYQQRDADFTHGVNFAVAGATALDAARFPNSPTNSSLAVQLGWFRDHLRSTCSSAEDCKRKLERALFMVGEVGGNDYNYALFYTNQTMEDAIEGAKKELTPMVVQAISDAVEEVISHGARLVVVPGNFPIGCMPGYLGRFQTNDSTKYDKFGCLGDLNELAIYHNKHLNATIERLKAKHPKVEIYYGDYFNGLRSIIRNAASFRFDPNAVFQPCCLNCWTNPTLCSNPDDRVSWDGIHLTQEAYKHLARFLMNTTFLHHED